MKSSNLRLDKRRRTYVRLIGEIRHALNVALAEESERRGLTCTGIAQLLDKHKSAISRQFSGVGNMTLETLADLAFALDRPVHVSIPARDAKLMADSNQARFKAPETKTAPSGQRRRPPNIGDGDLTSMPDPRSAFCIFCDDIRHEVSNKQSFIGVYNSDIIISAAPPIVLPKLGVCLWVQSDLDDRPSQLKIRVTIPHAGEILNADLGEQINRIPLQRTEGGHKAQFQTAIRLSPVPLTAEGYIEVWVDTERESFRANRLFVSFRPPEGSHPTISSSSELALPSEQSQPASSLKE